MARDLFGARYYAIQHLDHLRSAAEEDSSAEEANGEIQAWRQEQEQNALRGLALLGEPTLDPPA